MPSDTELLHEVDFRRYARDERAFFAEVWKIRHPEEGAIPLKLRPAQEEILEIWNNERLTISLKARQIGWSTLAAAHTFWLAFFHSDRRCIFLSAGEDEAMELLSFADYGYKRLPDWIIARGPKRTDNNKKSLTFDNGSSIDSLPTGQDPARGKTAYILFFDEFASLEWPDEAWASARPVVDIGGRMHIISTAKGSGTLFEDLWNKAETKQSKFKAVFYPWTSVPGRDDEWYQDQLNESPEWFVHQEYPRNPEEAFIKSGNNVFDVDFLRGLEMQQPRKGHLRKLGRRAYEFAEGPGKYMVWELPQYRTQYVIGADTAQGLEHGDYSVAYVVNLRTGKIVAGWHGHEDMDVFAQIVANLGYFYKRALVGVEANNTGFAVNTELKRLKYPNLYYRYILTTGEPGKRTKALGWYTSKDNKELVVAELNRDLKSKAITLLDEEAIAELVRFVRDEKGKMSGSPFDDRVMALGIMNQMRKHGYSKEYFDEPNKKWTLDWWSEQGKESKEAPKLGANNVR